MKFAERVLVASGILWTRLGSPGISLADHLTQLPRDDFEWVLWAIRRYYDLQESDRARIRTECRTLEQKSDA